MLDGGQYVALIQDAIWNTVNDLGYQSSTEYLNLLYNTNEIKYDPSWNYFNEYNQNTNWIDMVSRVGHFEDNSLSISGGGDKATYRVSLGYLNDVGTTKGTKLNRYNSLVSVNYKFSNKFNINSDLSYSRSIQNNNWMGFDQKKDGDNEYEIQGIRIFMNKAHGLYLAGMEIDFKSGLDARGFTFNNPNATSTCGCGSSFSA
jgi:Fe-S cluster assembly iron-binding protein IscA